MTSATTAMSLASAKTAALAGLIRKDLLTQSGVIKLSPCRRFTSIYSPDSPVDSVFFLDSGLVKVSKKGDLGKEIVLSVITPGQLFGEQSVLLQCPREATAEVMDTGTVYIIPRDTFLRYCDMQPDMQNLLAFQSLKRQRELERKIELLCLKDVEQRILLSLADLATTIGSRVPGGTEYSIPLSQSELAALIGATRETTSTTLNSLERRGLLHLGRRLLVIASIDGLVAAAAAERSKAVTAASV